MNPALIKLQVERLKLIMAEVEKARSKEHPHVTELCLLALMVDVNKTIDDLQGALVDD